MIISIAGGALGTEKRNVRSPMIHLFDLNLIVFSIFFVLNFVNFLCGGGEGEGEGRFHVRDSSSSSLTRSTREDGLVICAAESAESFRFSARITSNE